MAEVTLRHRKTGKTRTVSEEEAKKFLAAAPDLLEVVSGEGGAPSVAAPSFLEHQPELTAPPAEPTPDRGETLSEDLAKSAKLRGLSQGLAGGNSEIMGAMGHGLAALMNPYPVAKGRGIDAPAEEPGVAGPSVAASGLQALGMLMGGGAGGALEIGRQLLSQPGAMSAAQQQERELQQLSAESVPTASSPDINAPVTGRAETGFNLPYVAGDALGSAVSMGGPGGIVAKGVQGLAGRALPRSFSAMLPRAAGSAAAAGLEGGLRSLGDEPVGEAPGLDAMGRAGRNALMASTLGFMVDPVMQLPGMAGSGFHRRSVANSGTPEARAMMRLEQGGGGTAANGFGGGVSGVRPPPEHAARAARAAKEHFPEGVMNAPEGISTPVRSPAEELSEEMTNDLLNALHRLEDTALGSHSKLETEFYQSPAGRKLVSVRPLWDEMVDIIARRSPGGKPLAFTDDSRFRKALGQLVRPVLDPQGARTDSVYEALGERVAAALAGDKEGVKLIDAILDGMEGPMRFNASNLDEVTRGLDNMVSYARVGGDKDPALKKLGETLRVIRDDFGEHPNGTKWSKLKEQIHDELTDIENKKYALTGNAKTDLPKPGTKKPKQLLDTVAQKIESGGDDAEIRKLAEESGLLDMLNQTRASSAYEKLLGGSPHIGGTPQSAYASSKMRTLLYHIDPVFRFMNATRGPSGTGARNVALGSQAELGLETLIKMGADGVAALRRVVSSDDKEE